MKELHVKFTVNVNKNVDTETFYDLILALLSKYDISEMTVTDQSQYTAMATKVTHRRTD
jgi:hypothetical protein